MTAVAAVTAANIPAGTLMAWNASATATNTITLQASASTVVSNNYIIGTGNAGVWVAGDNADLYIPNFLSLVVRAGRAVIEKGLREFELPDGSVLHVDALGNYRLDDSKAKVVYQAALNREFNPYVNASDLIGQFIKSVGKLGVRRGEIAHLPLGLLVNWLCIEAAEKDGDPVPEGIVPVPQHRLLKGQVKPRCITCKRFLPRARAAKGIIHCRPVCAIKQLEAA